ncbi:DUF4148 domain-containing protein [Bordetella petrii]|uniref:DUF4148 domain-containing protein n=1 Tax=Bordetella petrii TaxID=94624 RepID=UPI001E4502A1|nr:DUF4148 domain-containing protein [Bordetella petrii]MCD0502556.1 DUF4148 domain-containing protein [Bordetella petrii]
MKTLATAVLMSLGLLSAGAYAASPNIEPNNVPFQGVYGQTDANAPTRAQVQADLAQAKAAGLVTYGESDYPAAQTFAGPGKTREQVRAELAQAKANGQYTFGELDYPPVAN